MKVFLFEWKRFIGSKIIWISLSILFLLIIGISIYSFHFSSPYHYVILNTENMSREELLEKYKEEKIRADKIIEQTFDPEEKEYYIGYKMLLEYYIANDLTEQESILLEYSTQKTFRNSNTPLMFYIYERGYFLIICLAVFISFFTFGFDCINGGVKNQLTICKRTEILKGKVLFQISLILLFITALSITVALVGINKAETWLIVQSENGFFKLNAIASIFIQSVGLFLLVLLISFGTNILLLFTKNRVYSITIIIFLFLYLVFLGCIREYFNFISAHKVLTQTDRVFLLNLFYIFRVFPKSSYIYLSIYLLLLPILILVNKKRFEKMGF